MRRSCITSWPLTALALLLLLCLSRSAATAGLLPLQQPDGVHPLSPHQDNGVKEAAAVGLVIQEDEAAGDGDKLSMSEMMGEGVDQTVACEESNNDECLQRRLLHDAHLDSVDYFLPLPQPPRTPLPSHP